MGKCPKCESEDTKTLKSWNLAPKKEYAEKKRINHVIEVTLILCRNCGTKFRNYNKKA